MHSTEKTVDKEIKLPSDNSAHIQDGGHNQQQFTTDIQSTTTKCDSDKLTSSQPIIEVCYTCFRAEWYYCFVYVCGY